MTSIFCATSACREPAKQVGAFFLAAGYRVWYTFHGGLGVTDVAGTRVEGCKNAGTEAETLLKKNHWAAPIEVVDDGPCDDERLVVIVGE